MEYVFKILRFDPEEDDEPRFQSYPYETTQPRTLLEALMEIRNEQDPSLSFRYSCREAVCGSCGMVIDGQIGLACKTQLADLRGPAILIEPLPNLEIEKDLIVDLGPFWEALEKVRPYLIAGERPEGGYRIQDSEAEELFQYAGCILCGCCYSACPVTALRKEYLGPAALAKLHRFRLDSRDTRTAEDVRVAASEGGLWACRSILRCNSVCPKQVSPAQGISGLRRRWFLDRIRRLFRFKVR